MSTTTGTKATAKPKATFAAGSFANLRAVAGQQGDAMRILLADIDEDPDQPRTLFDDDGIEAMAASIREHGVVQPITVRPPVGGRYTLVFGARRVRAARLAGQADIPAVIRMPSPDDYAAQVIENQQRTNLSNSDLATAIAKLSAAGKNNRQIGAICQLKDYQVAAFRQVPNLPVELERRLNQADMRAVYDLYRQWVKTPDAVIAALPDDETFITITEARRIIAAITGKSTGSIVLDKREAPAPEPEPAAVAPELVHSDVDLSSKERESVSQGVSVALSQPQAPTTVPDTAAPVAAVKPEPAEELSPASAATREEAAASDAPATDAEPVFMVAGKDGNPGRLVTDRRAERAGYALVEYPEGIEEVDARVLRIVEVQ
jgi:ParB family transcriptional regulator, chromosome partitioning protein